MPFRLISSNAFKLNIGIIMGTKEELENLLKERKELVLHYLDLRLNLDYSYLNTKDIDDEDFNNYISKNTEGIRENLYMGDVEEKAMVMMDNTDLLFLCIDELKNINLSDKLKLSMSWIDCLDFSTEENVKKSSIVVSKCIDKFLVLSANFNEPHEDYDNTDFPYFLEILDVPSEIMVSKLGDDKLNNQVFFKHLLNHCASLMVIFSNCIGYQTVNRLIITEEMNKICKKEYNESFLRFLQRRVGANKIWWNNIDNLASFSSLSLYPDAIDEEEINLWRETLNEFDDGYDISSGVVKEFLQSEIGRGDEQTKMLIAELCAERGSSNITEGIFELDVDMENYCQNSLKTTRKLLKLGGIVKEHILRVKNGDIRNLYANGGYSPILSCFVPIFESTSGAKHFKNLCKEFVKCRNEFFKGETLNDWGINNTVIKQYGLPTIEEYFLSHPIPNNKISKKILRELVGDDIFRKIENGCLSEVQSLSLLKEIQASNRTYFQTIMAKKFNKNSLPLRHPEHPLWDGASIYSTNVAVRMFTNDKTMSGKLLKIDMSSGKVIEELRRHFVSEDNGPSAINIFWVSWLRGNVYGDSDGNHALEFDLDMLEKVILPATYDAVESNTLLQALFGIGREECKNSMGIRTTVNAVLTKGIKKFFGEKSMRDFEYIIARSSVFSGELGDKIKNLLPA